MTNDARQVSSVLLLLARDILCVLGKKFTLIVTALMVLTALGEGLGIALLLPILTSIGVEAAGQASVGQTFIQEALARIGIENVDAMLALAIAFFATQAVFYLYQGWVIARWQRIYAAHWQNRLYQSFIRARWSFFVHHKQGDLINSITTETTRLAGAFFLLVQLIATVVTTIIYIGIAAAISWQTSLFLIGLAFLLMLSVRRITKKSRRIGSLLGPLNAELNIKLSEFLGGAKLIKATATESMTVDSVGATIASLRENNTWGTFLPGSVRTIFEFCALSALALLLVFGPTTLGIGAANLLVTLALFVRVFPRINTLQQYYQVLITYAPAVTVVWNLARAAEKEVESGGNEQSLMPRGQKTVIDIERGGYGENVILRDVRICLPQTGFVAVVGESGSGKSTLANCLLGLGEIQRGDICVGDIYMKQTAPSSWRRFFGYVTQETVLFHLTIAENVAWGETKSPSQIEDACRLANAHDFIMALPEGYQTIIGDQGARLSGGQRQRLGLARALLRQPSVLVLDEATSALDSGSERAILETIENLRQDICIVSVAHRLATVRNADRIYVMHQGRVTESGSWDELMARNGTLRHLAATQHIVAPSES
jgi:ATP-binding cassette subfamily C protein